jgi:predicted short-subunit dehydrogenase-like oxidoreductase (DUF2520 family)
VIGKLMTGKKTRARATIGNPSIAIVGAGSLGSFLAIALHDAGFKVTEIVIRKSARSRRRALPLGKKVGARIVTADSARLDTDLLWFCVPDGQIGHAATSLARRVKVSDKKKLHFAFHSSGALLGSELEPLRKAGFAVASVHPLMTFVAGTHPSMEGVPFALEGDAAATRMARRIVRALGAKSFLLPGERKAAYHAWATMTSPLLVAFMVILEEAAGAAGLSSRDARRKSLPIINQTLANYSRLGPAQSFSGPVIRGDAKTVAGHLAALRTHPGAREVYTALARAALLGLPAKNRARLGRLLRD